MTAENGQPKPARPAATAGPAWLRYPSQISDAEARGLLSAQDKAKTATPRLQTALTAATVAAILITILAGAIFNFSHFRAMDLTRAPDARHDPAGAAVDYTVAGAALLAVAAAGVALAGARLDVTERTRTLLMTAGAAGMVVMGAGAGVMLDPSRRALLKHYHVGVWGSRASFDRLMHELAACGWLVAACGVAVVVLMRVQRRRIAEAYPE
jgi:hypothetical protein